MSTTIVPIITTVSNNITNISNITYVTHNEKSNILPMEVYILLLVILGLIGITILIGLQDCAVMNHYHNFIQCMICEFSTVILSCFFGVDNSIKIRDFCRCKKNNVIRQQTYSDTESEYSNDEGYYPSKDTVINIEPPIMFVSEMPQLYLENNKDKKICSICCEELDNLNNEIDFKDTEDISEDTEDISEQTENNNEDTSNNINNIVKLECGHFYHSQCIEEWYKFSKNKDCPMCKSEIKVEDYYFT